MSETPEPYNSASVATSRRWLSGLRLLALVAALVAGGFAFHDFVIAAIAWWRWLVDLACGWILLAVALDDSRDAGEPAYRRYARWLAAGLGVAALGIAVREGLQPSGIITSIGAALVALVCFLVSRWVPFERCDVIALCGVAPDVDVNTDRVQIWRLAVAAAGIALCFLGTWLNRFDHLGGLLVWLLSLSLYASAWWQRSSASKEKVTSNPWRATGGPQLSPPVERIAFVFILLIGALLRFVQLETVPHTIPIDECLIGRHAEGLWQQGFPDFFGLGWNAYINLSFIAHYVGIQMFGMSMGNLRLMSAVIGWLTLIPMFYWSRRWWGNVIALLATMILAINAEHVHFSRVGFNVIQVVPIAALTLALFARALHSRRLIDWVWLGYAMGLGHYTYHSAKQYLFLLAIAGLFFVIGMRGFLRRYIWGALVGGIAYALVVVPIVPTILGNWELWKLNNANRVDSDLLTSAFHAGNGTVVWEYIGSHYGDVLRRFFNDPAFISLLSPAMSVPFLLGVGWLLWRWRDPRNLVSLAWLGGIVAAVGITIEPRFQRMTGFFPVVALLPALVAGHFRRLAHHCAPGFADFVVVPLLLVWLGFELHHTWYAQFIFDQSVRHPTAGVCRLMQRIPLPATYYTVGDVSDSSPKIAPSICMLADDPQRVAVDLAAGSQIVPVAPSNRGNAVLLIFSPLDELVGLVRHYYPDIEPQYYMADENKVNIYEFLINAGELDAHRGLRAFYHDRERSWSSPVGVAALQAPTAQSFPIAATGRGLVSISPGGVYAFRAADASLLIDGKPIVAGADVPLIQGWHSIAVEGSLSRADDRIALEWRRPEESKWQILPATALSTHPEVHALLGRYFSREFDTAGPEPIAVTPDASELVSVLSFDLHPGNDSLPMAIFGAHPSTMEWVGTVDLAEGDEQRLRLYATGPTQVFVDGVRVLSSERGDGRTPIETTIKSKSKPLSLLVRTVRPASDTEAHWILRLVWGSPGGGWGTFVRYQPAEEGG